MEKMQKSAVWEQTVEIPTYEVGEKDINPMFLEKRVYQGSSGRVYPYPVIDKIYDEKKIKAYHMVFLENQYLQVQIMPEIGGRIYRALDKTNDYDFVYYNRVIKPALVGLAGPWISGGIEFNWPQHHRPNTFGRVEYRTSENPDGSATVWVGEIDPMYGTKVTTGFTLYPDASYIEIKSQLYNRTPEPQTFLWWANPAVEVHNDTQSIFPPDVHAVFDHGKRDVSKFPIATGVYYKQDYSHGVDISKYKNIPVPTSYMAYHSDYNFVGGFDYRKNAGILHIADHHVAPGKKQWTWGCGDFGKAWDRNLTDEDGPYIELMTGVYTDNQPDFTWLQPYEEKTFTQYFMPYKGVGQVKNASTEVAVGLEVAGGQAAVRVYATKEYDGAVVMLNGKSGTYIKDTAKLSPVDLYEKTVDVKEETPENLVLKVKDADGREMISYRAEKSEIIRTPDPAKAIGRPEELKNTEALYLAGLHLEQYRHATYEPDPYYLEGLKRDPEDIRLNNAYGALMFRRCDFAKAEHYFRVAVKSATRHNGNPYDGEIYFNLGKALKFQGRLDEAYDAFYKSVWSAAWQGSGYFHLAQIAFEQKDYRRALEHIEHSLNWQYKNYKARNLKSNILRKLGRAGEAKAFTLETIQFDAMDALSRYELSLAHRLTGEEPLACAELAELYHVLGSGEKNYIALAVDYADCGDYEQAVEILEYAVLVNEYPMLYYYLAYYSYQAGREFHSWLKKANAADPRYCFPNTIYDYTVLVFAMKHNAKDDKALYYLGNLLYDKKRAGEAVKVWEKSIKLNGGYATAKRNLALAYFNKMHNEKGALSMLEQAFELNPQDARVFYELDQLYKKLNTPLASRLEKMEQHIGLVRARDDLYLEYVTIFNSIGRYETALKLIMERNFHPWEGGEGKIPAQYVTANVELAKKALKEGDTCSAVAYLEAAKEYPVNIGEGKLAGAQENNINYYLGCAYEQLGDHNKAIAYLEAASVGLEEPSSAMFYYDQPPHMIFYQGLAHLKLGNRERAFSRFNKLVDYGEKHIFEKQSIDYFAVSLPDFLVFEEDLDRKNQIHCNYMMGLGHIGLGNMDKAQRYLQKVLELDPNHQGAALHLNEWIHE